MGYTHNWKTRMPTDVDLHAFMFMLETNIMGRFAEHFNFELADSGALILEHKSGRAEGFTLGPDTSDFGESCKSDRGIAEIHITEVLWRTAFAINDAGGSMVLNSDWTYSPLRFNGQVTHDAKLALGILFNQCSDLLQGRKVRISAIPRPWPYVSEFRDAASEVKRMHHDWGKDANAQRVLFGIDSDGEPNYQTELQYGTPSFFTAINAHVNMAKYEPTGSVLRGLLFKDLCLWIDGKLFAGEVPPLANHSEVIKRSIDMLPMIPDQRWLDDEINVRQQESSV